MFDFVHFILIQESLSYNHIYMIVLYNINVTLDLHLFALFY